MEISWRFERRGLSSRVGAATRHPMGPSEVAMAAELWRYLEADF